jgi:hypothetical protein
VSHKDYVPPKKLDGYKEITAAVRKSLEGRLPEKVVGVVVEDARTGRSFQVSNRESRIAHLRKRIWEWGRVVDPLISGGRYVMKHLTLTYKPEIDWAPNQRRDFMRVVRKYFGDALVAYAIVAELHQSGRVHYQLLIVVRRGFDVPFFDVPLSGNNNEPLWRNGITRISSHANVGYLAKYLQKEAQKDGDYPPGCRISDVWIAREVLSYSAEWRFRLSTLPSWLSRMLVEDLDEFPQRASGGGWWIGSDFIASPFSVVSFVYG